MDLKSIFSGIFGGAKPGVGAPAHAQSIQAPAQSGSVTTDANRTNGVMLAQAQQTTQAPQAQSPEAQIKSLLAALDPMKALELLTKLMIPFMGMLGMGPAPTAEKSAQAQLGQGQAPQEQPTAQAIDQVMAQLGQEQAPQANTSDGLESMLQDIMNQTPQNGTPTASQPPVQLASQTPPAPASIQAPTLAA